MARPTWDSVNRRIIRCASCPRLIAHCKNIGIEKRKAYQDENYWAKPVPNFGDSQGRLLIVGLAPGAHGANRTGRMFTGDRSGDWLYRALQRAGFASQAESIHRSDGLLLSDCAITAVCHCAPPDNKPTAAEVANCRHFLDATFDLMNVQVFLALGKIAWDATVRLAIDRGWHSGKRPKFGHAAEVQLQNGVYLIGSYHPSQQNTFTGRLTEEMLDQVFRQIHSHLS